MSSPGAGKKTPPTRDDHKKTKSGATPKASADTPSSRSSEEGSPTVVTLFVDNLFSRAKRQVVAFSYADEEPPIVDDFRAMVIDLSKPGAQNLHLLYKEEILDGPRTLKSYKFQNEDIVYIVPVMKTAPRKFQPDKFAIQRMAESIEHSATYLMNLTKNSEKQNSPVKKVVRNGKYGKKCVATILSKKAIAAPSFNEMSPSSKSTKQKMEFLRAKMKQVNENSKKSKPSSSSESDTPSSTKVAFNDSKSIPKSRVPVETLQKVAPEIATADSTLQSNNPPLGSSVKSNVCTPSTDVEPNGDVLTSEKFNLASKLKNLKNAENAPKMSPLKNTGKNVNFSKTSDQLEEEEEDDEEVDEDEDEDEDEEKKVGSV